ncbi:MAG: homocysteine S-methyltransferase family protein [Oscillospiraceae bacterium]|nr:homocysteine S-methyltransferase family protein [Oscillospiraceae bacterium]
MSKTTVIEAMQKRVLYFDGAMGTMVQKHGLQAGESPEIFSLTHPEVIAEIHRSYLNAGADIVTANTFGANAHKLKATGYSPEEIISASVRLAKKEAITASSDEVQKFVALDIGPIGELLEPMGTLSFDDAYAMFKEEMIAGAQAGADLILIETMSDLYEIKAAILAAKENTDLPIFATLTVEENGRTYTGCSMESFAVLAESLGVSAIGLNCSLGPVQMLPHLKQLLSLSSLPILFQPNAGLPHVENGVTGYDVSPEQFGACQKEAVELGVGIVGGCCGTSPAYIEQAVKATYGAVPKTRLGITDARLCVPTAVTRLHQDTAIANTTSPEQNEALVDSLKDYDTSELINIALDAADEEAQVFCINVAIDGIDEVKMMKNAVKELQELCRLPFLLESENPDALEVGLRYFNGRGAVCIPERADLLAVAEKYGAVICKK